MVKGITAKFLGGEGGYSFLTMLDDLKVGDYVVVDAAGSIQVVEVQALHKVPGPRATKWAFQKVEIERLEELKALNERMKEVKDELEARLSKIRETELYEKLLASDPEGAALVTEYKSLLNGKLLKKG